jgi:ribosomal protein S15P/S13E
VPTHSIRQKSLDELERRLEENPDDEEFRRQRALIINRLEDLLKSLKEKTQH